VTHSRSLAGKTEGTLDIAGGGHDSFFALRLPQISKDFLLAVSKFWVVHRLVNSVPSNKLKDRFRIK
jgi:hypothetical protein